MKKSISMIVTDMVLSNECGKISPKNVYSSLPFALKNRCKRFLVSLLSVIMLLKLTMMPALATDTNFQQENDAARSDALTNKIQVLYNDRNGMPTSEANTVLQTQDGYIWVGSYGGLLRYDGETFRNFSQENTNLQTSAIRSLFEDDANRLFVGTNDQGVYMYQDTIFVPCNSQNDPNYRSVRCFAQNDDGVIFVGTSSGLAKIGSDNRLIPVDVPKLKNHTIERLSFDKNGVLWGIGTAGIAFALKDEQLVYWIEPGTLSPHQNYSILAEGKTVFIGTDTNILIELTLKDDLYLQNSYSVKLHETDTVNTINNLYRTKEEQLWLVSNTGAAYFDREMIFHYLPGFEYTFLNGIIQDYEGNIWMASMRQGLLKITEGKFFNANHVAELTEKSVNAVLNMDGFTFAATDYGLTILDYDWISIQNELTEQLDGVRIRHISSDQKGNIWFSSYSDYALIRYTVATGEIKTFTENDGMLSNRVRVAIELKNGDIAVGSTNGVNIIRDETIIESYGTEQGLENAFVLCLLELTDGTLLVGSDGMGIYAIKDGEIQNISKNEDLTSGVVFRMRFDEKADGIWISAGNDLFFAGKDGIQEITGFNSGIGSIFDILVIEDDIWLMKASGVIIASRTSLLSGEDVVVTTYGKESGLTANISAISWSVLKDNFLYLCSAKGVFLLDIEDSQKSMVPPKTAINEIMVEDKYGEITIHENPKNLTIPSHTRRITIRFACLSYGTNPCELQYFLENFDVRTTTLFAGEGNTTSYTNLKGGEYVFSLKARNFEGTAGETATRVVISKELSFFEHQLVRWILGISCILLIILIPKLLIDIKTRKLKKRQQEYKEITDQALKTIAHTIDAKDKYTNGHSQRVADYSIMISKRLGLSEDEQEKIYYIALLHDIGKIGIPDSILHKTGSLTDEEFHIMRSHTQIGHEILKDFTALEQIAIGALNHHENYDGTGYPEKKPAKETPLIARIIRVADAYDAMATNRSYRKSQSTDYIISELEKYSGIQFDPDLSAIMVELIKNNFEVK